MQPPIKKYIKAVVPTSTLRFFRERNDEASLSKQECLNFDSAPLKNITDIHLQNIFRDQDVGTHWNNDNATISKIFENEDKSLGVNPGDRRAIYYLLKHLQPKRVLEVGTHIAASTLYIAKAIQSAANDEHIDTVDIYDVNDSQNGAWTGFKNLKAPEEMLTEIGCGGITTFHDCGAADFLERTESKYDFIFLDGDHSAKAVYNEISHSLKCLNEGGVILLHDVYPDYKPLFPDGNVIGGPWRGAARVCEEHPSVKVLPLGDLPWATKQGVSKTSLALVLKDEK